MNKNLLILLLLLLLFVCGYFLWSNKDGGNELKTLEAKNRKAKDSLMTLFRGIQVDYNMKQEQVEVLEAELITQKAVVKQKEQKLAVMKVREKSFLAQRKQEALAMSEAKADSAIRYRFYFSDSSYQIALYQLAERDQCMAVRIQQDTLIQALRVETHKSDSLITGYKVMIQDSRAQVSLLLLASHKDLELIGIKNKQIRKQKRLKVLGFTLAVAAPVVTVLLLRR